MELPKPTVLQSIQQSTILHTRPSQKKTIKYIIYVFLDFATGVFDKPRVFRPQALPTLCCKNMEYSRPPLNPLSRLVSFRKAREIGLFSCLWFGSKYFFRPFWVQQGDASPVPFSRGDCKKKMQPEMSFLLRFRDNVILRNGGNSQQSFFVRKWNYLCWIYRRKPCKMSV